MIIVQTVVLMVIILVLATVALMMADAIDRKKHKK